MAQKYLRRFARNRKVVKAVALGSTALFLGLKSHAASLSSRPARGPLNVSKGAMKLYKSAACTAGHALGLCAERAEAPMAKLSLGGGASLRFKAVQAAPNRLIELAQLFINDMEVAHLGDYRIKLALELK